MWAELEQQLIAEAAQQAGSMRGTKRAAQAHVRKAAEGRRVAALAGLLGPFAAYPYRKPRTGLAVDRWHGPVGCWTAPLPCHCNAICSSRGCIEQQKIKSKKQLVHHIRTRTRYARP